MKAKNTRLLTIMVFSLVILTILSASSLALVNFRLSDQGTNVKTISSHGHRVKQNKPKLGGNK